MTPVIPEDVQQLAVGDSIFKTADIKEINKELGTEIKLASAYCPTYNQNKKNSKYEWSNRLNVESVLESELKKSNYNCIILGLPSIPITDLPGSNVEDLYLRQEASKSSYDMMKVAEGALEQFPATKQIFLVERAPRHDNKQALSEFANEEMHRILRDSKYKDNIKILKHSGVFF